VKSTKLSIISEVDGKAALFFIPTMFRKRRYDANRLPTHSFLRFVYFGEARFMGLIRCVAGHILV